MSTQQDQPTNSQPPDDAMGPGGETRTPGYGKYHPSEEPTDEHALGVPGAFGVAAKHEGRGLDVGEGDGINGEQGNGRPSKAPDDHEAG